MAFFCDRCGLCCKLLSKFDDMKEFDRGDGVCKYLKNSLCSIYEERPNICNAEYMWVTKYSKFMSREDFEHKSYEACLEIKKYFQHKN